MFCTRSSSLGPKEINQWIISLINPQKTSSWEFSLKSSGHDVFKKLYFLRDIPGRQKKQFLFFKEILLFNGLLFFKRPS